MHRRAAQAKRLRAGSAVPQIMFAYNTFPPHYVYIYIYITYMLGVSDFLIFFAAAAAAAAAATAIATAAVL